MPAATNPRPAARQPTAPLTFVFTDDGRIPNNRDLPFVVYRGAINLAGTPDPEDVIEKTFHRHGWGQMWRNGIYPYPHYHSKIHEVLGVARGRARVRFGGEHGTDLDLAGGDVVVLPAGTGHQCLWASPELVVIGAYPPGGRLDLCRGSKADHAKALHSIPRVPLPASDPVFGRKGPLLTLWQP